MAKLFSFSVIFPLALANPCHGLLEEAAKWAFRCAWGGVGALGGAGTEVAASDSRKMCGLFFYFFVHLLVLFCSFNQLPAPSSAHSNQWTAPPWRCAGNVWKPLAMCLHLTHHCLPFDCLIFIFSALRPKKIVHIVTILFLLKAFEHVLLF